MKCVRIVGQGIPMRMTDVDAAMLVSDGDGEYCTKSFWKQWHRDCGTEARAYVKTTGLQLSKGTR